jgi:twinkle protein
MESLELELGPDSLEPYLSPEESKSIKPVNSFTREVLDYYLVGNHVTGIVIPFGDPKKFRLRNGECTILAGINSAGKSLYAGQIMLGAIEQGYKCLSVSLEMSPRSQIARLWRQASLSMEPTIDFGLGFNAWARDKLYFFDKQGTIDLKTLMAVIRYAVDQFGIEFILVDSLMTIGGIANDDYTGQKQVVCEIADACRDIDCHIMLVAHARKSMSIRDKIDRFSIRGAGELADRVDNVILMGRYYDDEEDAPDAWVAISKARHWDMAECEMNLNLHPASLNLLTEGQLPTKLNMDNNDPDE